MAESLTLRDKVEAWFAAADEKTRKKRIVVAIATILVLAVAALMLLSPKPKKKVLAPEAPDAALVKAPKKAQDLEGIAREIQALRSQLAGAEEQRKRDLSELNKASDAKHAETAKKAATVDDAALERLIANRVESQVEKLSAEGKLTPRGGATLPPPALGASLPGTGSPSIPLLPPNGSPASTDSSAAATTSRSQRSLRSGSEALPAKSSQAATANTNTGATSTSTISGSASGNGEVAAIGKGNAKASTDNEARAAAADAPNAVARDAVAKRRDTQAGKEDAIHLPIGSILSGVTVTGIDAPTSAAAQRTPIPALLRLKANAILPNNYRVDIRECFVLVSGHGSLSTQRAKLRSNAISCVRNDGRVVESSLAGYVVGPDSREGVPGTLVHKSGEMIRNSLVAGVLSAGAARLGGTTTASLAGAGGLAAPGLLTGGGSDAAEGALAAGAGQSIAQISKLYLDMAKEAVPVIEVLPGTSVSLVLTSGVSLRFGK